MSAFHNVADRDSRHRTTELNSIERYDRNVAVHSLFGSTASRYSNAVALRSRTECVSYRELDCLSNQLAHRLRAAGAGPGSFIGILAGRSPDTIVAILGTLKCGAAYVPLDPAYPEQMIEFLISDCKPELCLVQRALLARAPKAPEIRVMCLDDELALSRAEPKITPEIEVDAGKPAYIMHTSGSTGVPKGVVIPHRAITRLICAQSYARFGPSETVLQLAPLAFDASTLEIWAALLAGGRLAIVEQPRPSLDEIVAALSFYQPTMAWFTAGLFHLLVDHHLDALKSLRQVLAGGDVLSPEHFERARRALPQCTLINGYGPTENTTFTCCYRAGPGHDTNNSVPIGKPISNTYVRILNDRHEPVAAGEVGFLYAGGDGLAIGYHNRPDWNAERFCADPLSSNPADRLYATGDLVRERPDGNIEFIGRADRQVKIDGRRIELDEIESALRTDTLLTDAIVMLRSGGGAKQIVAYVIPKVCATAKLRSALVENLRRRLPSYMVPSEIVVLSSFPLNTNGKVDRNALLRIAAPYQFSGELSKPARGDLEIALRDICAGVLKKQCVPRAVNFFDLGCTSLQMIELHSEIRKNIAPNITLVELFDHPNLASLAAYLSGSGQRFAGSASDASSRACRQNGALRRLRNARRSS